jgi:hypothetical protein
MVSHYPGTVHPIKNLNAAPGTSHSLDSRLHLVKGLANRDGCG